MATRPIPSHLRNPSLTQNLSASASPALQARIEEKRTELANLRELRDLSAQLANQMHMLEQKLSTLSNGTEAVAAVLGNWADVLKAIGMASSKIPKAKDDAPTEATEESLDNGIELPQTLVRIPVGQDMSGLIAP